MTSHCPRSNWTGPESEIRRGICPKCAETTLYEDCEVRPMAITFTDGEGVKWTLFVERPVGPPRDATPADLALAGYEPTTQALDRLTLEAAIVADDTRRELEALRKLEQHIRGQVISGFWFLELENLVKAIDEARK